MDSIKIVFVQAEDDSGVAKFLGGLEQQDYCFVVLPMNAKILTKEELISLLQDVLKGV